MCRFPLPLCPRLTDTHRLRTAALVTAVAAAGIGLTIRNQANALRANEQAQLQQRSRLSASPSSGHTPNLYVSVDRSGGGI